MNPSYTVVSVVSLVYFMRLKFTQNTGKLGTTYSITSSPTFSRDTLIDSRVGELHSAISSTAHQEGSEVRSSTMPPRGNGMIGMQLITPLALRWSCDKTSVSNLCGVVGCMDPPCDGPPRSIYPRVDGPPQSYHTGVDGPPAHIH